MLTTRSTIKPNLEPYLTTKQKAIELINDIDLYLRQPIEQYQQIIKEIVHSVMKCQEGQQRGEIYLLLCQSTVKMAVKIGEIPLPTLFQDDVFTYLSTLIEDQPTERKQTSQIYRLKQVPATERIAFRDGKTKLKDLLLIQRYDVVLAALVRELEEGSVGHQQQRVVISKEFQNFIEGTLRIAQRYLQKKEYGEYRDNVNIIVKGKTEKIKKVVKRISRSLMSLSQHYMLIDSAAHLSGFFVRGGKSQKQGTVISGGRESNRSSSSKRSSSKRSFLKDQFMDLRGIGEGLHLKKNSMMIKSIKRASGVSNCTLRSSIVMNHNFLGSNPSNFGLASRRPPRSSARLVLRSSELKVGENKPERMSRFQILSKFQQQSLKQEYGQLQGQADHEVISSTTLLPQQKTSRVYCYLQEGQRPSWHELHPFFIFLQINCCTFLVRVQEQELEGSELLQSGQIKALVRVKLIQDELQFYLTLDLDIEWNQDEDIEVICQEYLVKHLNITKKDKQVKVSIESQEIGNQRGNLIRLGRSQEGVLMGFIRKISTYFIHKSKYLCSSLHKIFEYGLRKRLVTESKALPFPIPVQSRLMNSDLTMSFQEQQIQMVRSGSVIAYIQNEQLSLGLNFNTDESFKLIFEHCALREWEDIKMWRIWAHPKYKQVLFQPKRKKGRKFNSRIHKAITADEQNSSRKLKKMAHNKSSIRLQSPELEALYQQFDLRVTNNSKTASKRDMISEKRISKDIAPLLQAKTKKQRKQDKRTTVFIESIRTERGYKLSKKSVVQHISGFVYNEYQGHSERNPQMTRFYKGQPSESVHSNFLQPSMSIRGNQSQTSNIKLLTFVKPLHSIDDHFLGYLISDIKILILSANRCIFIETYWQRMQKHFIFTLSNEFFEQLTDVNTSHFWEKPIVRAEDKVSKKREKRTSVMNYFHREKKERSADTLHGSRRNKVGRDNSLGNEEEAGKVSQFARFKETKTRFGQTLKIETSAQSLNSFATMKTGQRLQFKRQLSSRIKSKLVRSAVFLWKEHTLRLLIHHNAATATHYSPASYQFQFIGRELAVKNTHQSPSQPALAAAIELILIRYKENNLTNLNIFTQQGINQISLEHIFIKNNDDLYGRYENLLNLSTLPPEIPVKQYYQQNNRFFDKNVQKQDCKIKLGKSKSTAMKFTGREEQKRFKYVQILGFAKECSLPFDFVQEKRKKHVKRTFVIPNRYKVLEQEQEILHIHLYSDVVKVKTLQGAEIITFSIKKMENYLPFIRKLSQQQFKKIFLRRVLEDEDIMRLCQQTEEETF